MTALDDTPDTARAKDLNCAREAYRTFPIHNRPDFGVFCVTFLREHGIELTPRAETPQQPCDVFSYDGVALADCLSTMAAVEMADRHPALPDSPFTQQAVFMSVEEIADLLAALAERGLTWVPGEGGPDASCGTLIEGPPEPPDLHVVFDRFRSAWQRDDDHARELGDPCLRWFRLGGRARTWADLQRGNGPLTPEGGTAPTTPPADDSEPF